MADPPMSDKSLLERLNALKPSPVSLTSPLPSKPTPASTIERAKSPSREDALTARLKSLRNQGSKSIDSTSTSQEHGVKESTQPLSTRDTRPLTRESGIQQTPIPIQVTDDADPLYTDDQTLEELLADLRDDDSWLDDVAAEEEEHQRVTALLTELSKPSAVSTEAGERNTDQNSSQEDSEGNSDDDSEKEEITATEADSVLAKTLDELEWEKANKHPSPSPESAPTPPENAKQTSSDTVSQVPDGDPFNLPTVPSELPDQIDPPASFTQTQSDADFASSIESRMAALKLSGRGELPSAPTDAVDSLGLPQAPTFAPSDRPVPGLAKRTGLTDEDQKNWCVVCLEDGAVRCLGCEDGDNVYCARCWKEMHVGPQAGYDERGHSWETFAQRPR